MKEQKNFFYEFVMDSPPGAETIINGKKYLYYGGVSYFQLHSHPEVLQAAVDATLKYGMNSATSRSITGMTQLHLDLEMKAANFFGSEDAAFLPSGYLSNIAGIQALDSMGFFDVIFIDETAHYCNRDGAYSVNKPVFKFNNNDYEDLKTKIRGNLKSKEKPLVIMDGVFSVFGIMAAIPEFLKIIKEYNGIIWIDDAHASGIVGPNGKGTYDFYNLNSDRLFFGSTLSKAFGGFGGIIPGNYDFIKQVRCGNVLNGGSQPTSAATAASLKGLDIVMANPEMRESLWKNALFLKKGLRSLGIQTEDNYLPMAAFSIGSEADMKNIHNKLLKRGIFIQYSKYIGAGREGVLRMVVFSTHRKAQIQYLIDQLREVI
jgi:7-keto-8-aminopelargonate synthetase-like enzyme